MKSNDQSSPDYVPSVNMGYDKDKHNPEQRKARLLRVEKRETERKHNEVALSLLDEETTSAEPELPGVFKFHLIEIYLNIISVQIYFINICSYNSRSI